MDFSVESIVFFVMLVGNVGVGIVELVGGGVEKREWFRYGWLLLVLMLCVVCVLERMVVVCCVRRCFCCSGLDVLC